MINATPAAKTASKTASSAGAEPQAALPRSSLYQNGKRSGLAATQAGIFN
jgi:hypothetical protein